MITKFANAFYIKLGRGGKWEADSIENGLLRLGWSGQLTQDINKHHWALIGKQLQEEHKGKRQVATNDLNRLRDIAESTPKDVWITFHKAKLWWTRLAPSPLENDAVSQFRRTLHPWKDRSETGRLLVVNELPGKIAQLQGFRGTVCSVQEKELLFRVLKGARSGLATNIARQRKSLANSLAKAISELHWKDFETLVDLVFRDAGWVRISVLGQHAKAYDLELLEPITEHRYVVQVKSQANRADLDDTVSQFSSKDYHRVFFVVHSPAPDLANANNLPEHVEVVPPAHLGELAAMAGLSKWIEDKVA